MREHFDKNTLNLDFSDFKVVWVDCIPFIVPDDISAKEEKYLIASQLTLLFEQKSVDNVLKNYMSDFEEEITRIKQEPKEILIKEVLELSKQSYTVLRKKFRDIDFKPETMSSLACEAVFARLATTFRSIHYNIKFCYYFESFALIRLVLEQLAYSYTASQVSSGRFKTFFSPTKSIGILKNLLPTIGKVYNLLSKKAHLDKSEIKNYIKIENEQQFVLLNSEDYALEACAYLLLIIDFMNCTFEYCFKNYNIKFENICLDRNKAVFLKEDRSFKKLANSKIERIELLLDLSKHKLMRV